jgi:hypothetical protein
LQPLNLFNHLWQLWRHIPVARKFSWEICFYRNNQWITFYIEEIRLLRFKTPHFLTVIFASTENSVKSLKNLSSRKSTFLTWCRFKFVEIVILEAVYGHNPEWNIFTCKYLWKIFECFIDLQKFKFSWQLPGIVSDSKFWRDMASIWDYFFLKLYFAILIFKMFY